LPFFKYKLKQLLAFYASIIAYFEVKIKGKNDLKIDVKMWIF
jgi:hypothetical protein